MDIKSEIVGREEYVQICKQAFFHLQLKLQCDEQKVGNKATQNNWRAILSLFCFHLGNL